MWGFDESDITNWGFIAAALSLLVAILAWLFPRWFPPRRQQIGIIKRPPFFLLDDLAFELPGLEITWQAKPVDPGLVVYMYRLTNDGPGDIRMEQDTQHICFAIKEGRWLDAQLRKSTPGVNANFAYNRENSQLSCRVPLFKQGDTVEISCLALLNIRDREMDPSWAEGLVVPMARIANADLKIEQLRRESWGYPVFMIAMGLVWIAIALLPLGLRRDRLVMDLEGAKTAVVSNTKFDVYDKPSDQLSSETSEFWVTCWSVSCQETYSVVSPNGRALIEQPAKLKTVTLPGFANRGDDRWFAALFVLGGLGIMLYGIGRLWSYRRQRKLAKRYFPPNAS